MITEISIAVIAAAFVVLVIFLILTLISVRNTFNHLNAALGPVQRHTEDLCEQAENLLDQTTRLTKDLNHKSEALGTVFNNFANVGNSFKKPPPAHLNTLSEEEESALPVEEVLEWVVLGLQLFKKFKNRR